MGKKKKGHTPGKWWLEGGYIMAAQPETAGPGEELPPEYEVASVGDGGPILTEREKADARLIAAAPDLLAACEAMLDHHAATFANMAGEYETEDQAALAKQAEAAIGKARGES